MSGLTRLWWMPVVRGIAAVLFGLAAFVWPGLTLMVLVYLFGAYALVDGIVALAFAFQADRWWAFVAEGVLSIAAGVVAFAWPGITALALLYLIAAWAILTGVLEIVAAVRLRTVIEHEWWLALGGVASVILGVILVAYPGEGALGLIWAIGAYAVVFGVALIALGLRLRRLKGLLAPEPPRAGAR